jgi:hypothetical protein
VAANPARSSILPPAFDGGTGSNTCIGVSTAAPPVVNCQGSGGEPVPPAVVQQLAALEAAVGGAGPGAGLTPLVRQAREQVEAGRPIVACGLLQGFIAQAQAFGSAGLIAAAQAQQFAAQAGAIRATLSCG